MADYVLTPAELSLGYFDKTTIAPGGKIISKYSNSMGDLLHEWLLNYLDSEPEKDIIGALDLTREGGVSKTPDGDTGWAATLDGTGKLTASGYALPSTATIVLVFKITTVGDNGLIYFPDQLKVWVDGINYYLHIWFKDDAGVEHTFDGTTIITADTWHQITVGIGGGKVRITLDSALEIDEFLSFTGFYQPTPTAGSFGFDGTNYLVGKIDRIKIYSRVFGVQDATEEQNYNTLLGDFPATAIYRTPWFDLDYATYGECLNNYTFTTNLPEGTSITDDPQGLGNGVAYLILTTGGSNTAYGRVLRADASDVFKRYSGFSTSTIRVSNKKMALEFQLTNA